MAVPGLQAKAVSALLAPPDCPTCGVRGLCLPAGLDAQATCALDALFSSPRRLARREVLFRAGDPFMALHAVRVGTLKTVRIGEQGGEQIVGYHMGGDVVGFDGLAQGTHACDAIAIEYTEARSLPFARLEELARREPALMGNLFRLASRELLRSQELAVLLGGMCAEERLATFLLELGRRSRARGLSASEFVLRMTREEIATFLGLQLETVSRVFSRLHGEGLIQVQGRAVKLIDIVALRRLAGHSERRAAAPVGPR